jgi:hypothetical protein
MFAGFRFFAGFREINNGSRMEVFCLNGGAISAPLIY